MQNPHHKISENFTSFHANLALNIIHISTKDWSSVICFISVTNYNYRLLLMTRSEVQFRCNSNFLYSYQFQAEGNLYILSPWLQLLQLLPLFSSGELVPEFSDGYPVNITVQRENTAFLDCPVKNPGDREFSETGLLIIRQNDISNRRDKSLVDF